MVQPVFERTATLAELPRVAEELLTQLAASPIVLLEGEMGAGKTTLVQQLVKALGSQATVTSPTFALVQQYPTPRGTVYHLDLHRIQYAEELVQIGFDELLDNAAWCFIEWPERAKSLLPATGVSRLEIKKLPDPTQRQLRLFR